MNKYVIFALAGLLAFLINYAVFSFGESKFECGILTPTFMCAEHIIKQNDWLICAELHKATHGYSYDNHYGAWGDTDTNANNSEELKRLCGEIP